MTYVANGPLSFGTSFCFSKKTKHFWDAASLRRTEDAKSHLVLRPWGKQNGGKGRKWQTLKNNRILQGGW